jgi:hypothetical protein
MGGPAFLITRDTDYVKNPTEARKLLRGNNIDTLKHAVTAHGGLTEIKKGWLRFPADACLLMIGQTKELLDACEQAKSEGIDVIASESENPLGCFFVRIKVSPIQTDTLLALLADDSWSTSGAWSAPPVGKKNLPWVILAQEDDKLAPDLTDQLYKIIKSCDLKYKDKT